jgi:hypothetical protein
MQAACSLQLAAHHHICLPHTGVWRGQGVLSKANVGLYGLWTAIYIALAIYLFAMADPTGAGINVVGSRATPAAANAPAPEPRAMSLACLNCHRLHATPTLHLDALHRRPPLSCGDAALPCSSAHAAAPTLLQAFAVFGVIGGYASYKHANSPAGLPQ